MKANIDIKKIAKNAGSALGKGAKNAAKGVQGVKNKIDTSSIISTANKEIKSDVKLFNDEIVKIFATDITDKLSLLAKYLKTHNHGRYTNCKMMRDSLGEAIASIKQSDKIENKEFVVEHLSKYYQLAIKACDDTMKFIIDNSVEVISNQFELGDEVYELPFEAELNFQKRNIDVIEQNGFSWFNENTSAELATMILEKPHEEIDFDDNDYNLRCLRETLSDNEGVIESCNGTLKNGDKYAYSIVKFSQDDGEHKIPGVGYTLQIDIKHNDQYHYIAGMFIETGETGERDSYVFLMLRNKEENENGTKVDAEEFLHNIWLQDPYDKTVKTGFLMNLSEKEEFDQMFPMHPLSVLRNTKNAILGD